jgi:hypothetical protein
VTDARPPYQPFYCEENVWHLCQHALVAGFARSAVFLANPSGGFVMWQQRAAPRAGRPIFWDYHVVLLTHDPPRIWDLDTLLPCPIAAGDYLRQSFSQALPEAYTPRLRVVDADEYVRTFASDRAHMRRPDGSFERPPPPWAPIGAPGAPSTLRRFIDMRDPFVGDVATLDQALERFG